MMVIYTFIKDYIIFSFSIIIYILKTRNVQVQIMIRKHQNFQKNHLHNNL